MISLRDYPYWAAETMEHVKEQLRQICNLRKDDIAQVSNLGNVFISGRKVGRVPSGSTNVIDGDRVGDFNVTASFAYFLIDNSGTPAWRRVAVSSW